MTPFRFAVLVLILKFAGFVSCDVPVNCTYDEIVGEWLFYEGERSSGARIDCREFTGPNSVFKVNLLFPDLAVDAFGNRGRWTAVYNQGFEVVLNYRKYFAFSMYEKLGNGTTISYCDLTKVGWSHDIFGKNWACYYGERINGKGESKAFTSWNLESGANRLRNTETYVQLLNIIQDSWTAKAYPELRYMPYKHLLNRAGGVGSRVYRAPPLAPIDPSLEKQLSQLPEEFDWRNVNGENYVTPVREQGACGSCYAFSSLAMLESRLRIMTNNTVKVVFSPQDVVSCSRYTQGCEGGFPYVSAGKYAQDFGLVTEECYPYEGRDDRCRLKRCKRYFVAEYNYVGGYFGGCNEALMRLELVQNGPMTVAMEVYDDLLTYESGIYHHTEVSAAFSAFQLVNHGVLIVGYGVSNTTGEKYWVVKNSWGESWGEDGYFRIRRGTNECNIESMAVSAKPIP